MKTILFLALVLALICHSQQLERKSYLKCDQRLHSGQFLQSDNGYYAILQSDCNLVIYASKHFVNRNALWSSGSARRDCKNPILVHQTDGNVVIYNNGITVSANAVWNSGTAGSTNDRCYRLIMQNDGNLVLYNSRNSVTWNTKTSA